MDFKKFLWDNHAMDEMIDWVCDNIEEEDFREETGTMHCNCEEEQETIGVYYFDWEEQDHQAVVYYCKECKGWAIDNDF